MLRKVELRSIDGKILRALQIDEDILFSKCNGEAVDVLRVAGKDYIWFDSIEDVDNENGGELMCVYREAWVQVIERTGCDGIALERERQVSKEGWTAENDDGHTDGGLAISAACYAVEHTDCRVNNPNADVSERGWPWNCCEDKRSKHDVLKRLTIAGALIAAEIDRLLRLAGKIQPKKETK